MASGSQQSYIDYATFTSPEFSPTSYANSLVLQTNNPTDTPLDLSTPLSRVLFDVQEVDTHIDSLATQSALPIVEDLRQKSDASAHILEEVESQVAGLQESYHRLEREVTERYEAAEQVRLAAERMVATLRLGRSVQRAVQLGRQLESQVEGLRSERGLEYRSMVPAANTLLSVRQLFGASGKGDEGEWLARVSVVNTLRTDIVGPAERTLLGRAQAVVREFSMSSLLASGASGQQEKTYAQTEDTKNRATSALQTLYLLSTTKAGATEETFEPVLLIQALQSYLQMALTSSIAALSRALATLPTLDRALLEVSARCQNIVALEALLEAIKPPVHPLLSNDPSTTVDGSDENAHNFLTPLLRHLDTTSLPSYFWRTMSAQLPAKVSEIISRGGVSARTLRTNRDRVRDAIRQCVDRGSRLPAATAGRKEGGKVGNWEREAAVMVGAVIGPIDRGGGRY
ncbi:hypothetical protein EJ03DRAFT_96393 [Teratosphaeria nubilosa]|uniref:Conserved oligomeric Golgi complex subunit 5 n=1 Tax=Teratosphaeria nubilosa TaxID=161662 RepID=A0A6G1LB06_9PEZI|nr:hypothetical protein EJ03DRAFT_96393 [Teratosphaeria nubilosa]